MDTFASKSDPPSPQLYCCVTRAWGKARKAQAPVPWSMSAAFRALTPIAEFMPRLREILEEHFPSTNSDHDREDRRSKRAFSPSTKTKWLEKTTLQVLVPAAGTTP